MFAFRAFAFAIVDSGTAFTKDNGMSSTEPSQPKSSRVRDVYTWALGFPLAMTGAATITGVQLATGFRARKLCANTILPVFAKSCLSLMDIKFVVHGRENIPSGQAVYISNHPSFLDLFLMASLKLPNLRSFLSEDVLKYIPIAVIGKALGYFFTPDQTDRNRRVECFQNAASVLRETGDSIFVTPQGERRGHEIGHFNKGAFHLAMDLRAPLVPIFIETPKSMNPGMDITAIPGTVHIYIDPPVDTSTWTIEGLDGYPRAFERKYEAFPEGWSVGP